MDIYTPIEVARDLIHDRWNDQHLRRRVEEKLIGDVPAILRDGPSGFIWRQIGSPSGEFTKFVELCREAQVKPLCFEYTRDKFAARNYTKHELTSMPFINGVNKHHQTLVARQKIIDFNGAEKKRMCELETLWGENLVDFHHFLLTKTFPQMTGRVIDLSEWIKRNGETPVKYYSRFLTLAVAHAMMFDDLDAIEKEEKFAQEIIVPACHEVEREFGVRPLIVKIPNPFREDPFHLAYPKGVKQLVDRHVRELTMPTFGAATWWESLFHRFKKKL